MAGHERRATLQRIGEIAVADPHVRRSLYGGRRRLGHRPGHRALDLFHRTTARCASAELREEENRNDQRVSRSTPSQHLNVPPWRPLTAEAPVLRRRAACSRCRATVIRPMPSQGCTRWWARRSYGRTDRTTWFRAMSLCAYCGQATSDHRGFCAYHAFGDGDWATSNRIMCD